VSVSISNVPIAASMPEPRICWQTGSARSMPSRWQNRQGFSHREADAKSLLDEAVRRGMGEQRGTNGDGGSGEGG
jgi:hypothetical protein